MTTSARPPAPKGCTAFWSACRPSAGGWRCPPCSWGDFNAEPGAPELAALQKDGCALRDAAVAVPLTFHGYGLGCEPQQKIDYLFTSPELRVLACRAWTDEENGVYLSDHYPLCAELAL